MRRDARRHFAGVMQECDRAMRLLVQLGYHYAPLPLKGAAA